MKKAMIILCSAVMALSIAACGTGTQQTTVSSQTPSSQSGASASSAKSGETSSSNASLLSAGFVDIMKSEKYLMRYKTSVSMGDETFSAEVTTATDGKTFAAIMKSEEINTHTIIKGSTLYMLDDTNKTYSKMSLGSAENTMGELMGTEKAIDTEGLNFVSKGTGKVNGKTLPYEEYSTGDETLRFFMDGQKLYAITTKTKELELTLVILELSNEVPEDMLSVPSSYKEGQVISIPGLDMGGGETTESKK
ncbi:MAG: hypothetical protein GX424_10205 [Clostridiales bacterium]|nr:hypothetical protein [Clostridiales bacterium]